jgi:hypothetical protein
MKAQGQSGGGARMVDITPHARLLFRAIKETGRLRRGPSGIVPPQSRLYGESL